MTPKIAKATIALIFIAPISGCVTNDYAKFYRDSTADIPAEQLSKRLLPYSGKTQLVPTNDPQGDGARLAARNYVFIGSSEFEGEGKATDSQLLAHAQKVGADIVLYRTSYLGARNATIPIVHYTPGQTSTTRINGYAGGTNYSSTATTSSLGTFSTQYAQTSAFRYSWGASFWRKGRPPVLGVNTTEIPEPLRQKLKRNTGAYVTIVFDESPAFRSNLLRDDIIISIMGEPIATPIDLSNLVDKYRGRQVNLELIRGESRLTIPVKLGN